MPGDESVGDVVERVVLIDLIVPLGTNSNLFENDEENRRGLAIFAFSLRRDCFA